MRIILTELELKECVRLGLITGIPILKDADFSFAFTGYDGFTLDGPTPSTLTIEVKNFKEGEKKDGDSEHLPALR